MAIKEIYEEVEKDKKNKVKGKEEYSMPLNEFIDEHKKLIKILREGKREELLAEADNQEEELEECLEDHGMSTEEDSDEDDE